MQSITTLVLLLAVATPLVAGETTNPLSKVIELIDSLLAKTIKAGEVEARAYDEYIEWCDDAAKNKQFEIKTATAKKGDLEAAIEKATGDIEASTSKIEELAAAIASGEGDLKNATLIRDKENAEFVAAEKELVETIDTLDRAISILEAEMAKNPALVQVDASNMQGLVQALSSVIDAASFSSRDKQNLLALVQQSQQMKQDPEDASIEAEEATLGAPAATVYKTHSTSIVEVLEDLKGKAEAQLSELRKAETNAAHNFAMLKQSLEDQAAYDKKNMGEEKALLASTGEAKATAEGDLAVTVKDLANAEEALATVQSSCMEVATDHDGSVKSRQEEVTALETAKKILTETSAGAVEQTYSLLQVATGTRLRTRADLANAEVVNLVKHLSEKYHSASLAQLASRIAVAMRYGAANGDDVFAKVKGLIKDLIERLLAEAAAEATEKAYCDEQMAKTEAKKADLEDEIAKLTSKIDTAAAASAKLKEEVKELQDELAALAQLQAEMDKTRADENAAYLQAKADLELGLDGVQKALAVLREYYEAPAAEETALVQQPPKPVTHEKAGGAGGGIIDILEVVESDFATNLADEEKAEADAVATYEKVTQENKVTKALKDQDVKYKTQEFTALDKEIAELTGDKETASTELVAVLDYYEKIKDRCIAKPETYEERQRRRQAEIAGLKEALSILESEAALVQRSSSAGALRR